MYWEEIDPQNLPKGEVLAINLKSPDAIDYGEKGLGYLEYDMGRIWCRDKFDNTTLIGATHYIAIDSIQVPAKIQV